MRGLYKTFFFFLFLNIFTFSFSLFAQVTPEDFEDVQHGLIEVPFESILYLHRQLAGEGDLVIGAQNEQVSNLLYQYFHTELPPSLEEAQRKLGWILKELEASQTETAFFTDLVRRWLEAMETWKKQAVQLLVLNQTLDERLARLSILQEEFERKQEDVRSLEDPGIETSAGGIVFNTKDLSREAQARLENMERVLKEKGGVIKKLQATRRSRNLTLFDLRTQMGLIQSLATLFGQQLSVFGQGRGFLSAGDATAAGVVYDAEDLACEKFFEPPAEEVFYDVKETLPDEGPVLPEAQILFDHFEKRISDAIITKVAFHIANNSKGEFSQPALALMINNSVMEFLDEDMIFKPHFDAMIEHFVETTPEITPESVQPFVRSLLQCSLKK